jgi:Uma2 family endonuclease
MVSEGKEFTMSSVTIKRPTKLPTRMLELLPSQGDWSEDEYLWLSERTNRLLEFTDGYIEELPMPTDRHQASLEFLFYLFRAVIQNMGGRIRFAPLRLRVGPNKFREPDILLLCDKHDARWANQYWNGADLVVEIVSPDKPSRDVVEKRTDYAEGNIPEYWIVNPETETITVLRLEGNTYTEHGVFGRGTNATSVLLPGFTVSVDNVLDAE